MLDLGYGFTLEIDNAGGTLLDITTLGGSFLVYPPYGLDTEGLSNYVKSITEGVSTLTILDKQTMLKTPFFLVGSTLVGATKVVRRDDFTILILDRGKELRGGDLRLQLMAIEGNETTLTKCRDYAKSKGYLTFDEYLRKTIKDV